MNDPKRRNFEVDPELEIQTGCRIGYNTIGPVQ